MRELVYYVAVSLDGYIASPEGRFDDFAMEGDHMAAILAEYVDTIPAQVATALGLASRRERFDTVLMGWNTYAVGLDDGIDDPYPFLRQIVFSRRRREVPPGIRLESDPVAVVRELKAEPEGAGIWLCGGGALAGGLVSEIDRLVLKVNPVVFGGGIPLIAGAYRPSAFREVDRRAFESGVAIAEYERRR